MKTSNAVSHESISYIKKPTVAVGAVFISFSFAVLKFPEKFHIIMIIAVVCAAIFSFLSRKDKSVACVLFVCIILGALIPYASYCFTEKNANRFLEKYSGCHTFTGVVTSFDSNGSYSGFDVKVTQADNKKLKRAVNINTYCFSSDYADVGDTITFTGEVQSVYECDDTDFDTASYLRSKRIFAVVPNAVINSSSASKSINPLQNLRRYIHEVYATYLPSDFDYTALGVAKALVTGQKDYLDNALHSDFKRAGTLHLLCVSGMHLSVISGVAFFILSRLTLHKRLSIILIILICVFYTFLTGATASIVRSCIMSCLAYSAMLFGRTSDGAVSLFLSAAFMTAFDPYMVLGIGAQLSFLATLGIIVGSMLSERLEKNSGLLGSLVISVCAFGFTLPLSAFAFGGVSLFSVISTIISSPFCDASLILLIFLVLISPFSHIGFVNEICIFISELCNYFLNIFIGISRFFSFFRYAYIPFPDYFDKGFAVFCAVLLAISLALYLADSKRVKLIAIITVTLSLLMLVFSLCISIYDNSKCKVWYYRKSKADTQISIKTGNRGAIIINNDNLLCNNPDKAYFDSYCSDNVLVIIPNQSINPKILGSTVKGFDEKHGISKVYVADIDGANELIKRLYDEGVQTERLLGAVSVKDVTLGVSPTKKNDGIKLEIFDGSNKICAVIANSYNENDYSVDSYVNAFFTSETKNQFDYTVDTAPLGKSFFTRLKKGEQINGITNTFGQSSIRIY